MLFMIRISVQHLEQEMLAKVELEGAVKLRQLEIQNVGSDCSGSGLRTRVNVGIMRSVLHTCL